MATQNISYGSRTAITVTLTSLASGAARQSVSVDNTTNKYDDAVVFVQTNAVAGATLGLEVYVYAWDGASVFTDLATGTDATFTTVSRKNAALLDVVNLNAAVAQASSLRRSVASCFNGVMPAKWGLIFVNNSGGALSSTAGDHIVSYQGITYTVA